MTGFCQNFIHLLISRFFLTLAQSGLEPLGLSLIGDFVIESKRGIHLGIFNAGVFIGKFIIQSKNLLRIGN
jgi:MFS family permease